MSKHKTAEQQAFLRETIPDHTYAETAKLYNERFGEAVTVAYLHSWAYRHGVKRDIEHVEWTQDKLDYMAEIIPGHTESEIRELFAERYGVELTEGQIGNTKQRLGIKSGTTGGRFEKGNVPMNKGKTWNEYMSKEAQERSRSTQFRKGDLPHTTREIGVERITRDGYIQVHICQHRKRKANDQWRLKHHLVWEQANGRPVPPHAVIAFADRDKRNFDPDNLVAVPRDLWSVISQQSIAYHDRESLEVAMDIAKLRKGVYAKKMRPRECRKCGATFEPRYPHQRTCDFCLGRDPV